MYTFLLMVKDYFGHHNMHWFMLFFLFVLIRWLIVFLVSLKYKKYEGVSDAEARKVFSSVLIPVVDEPVDTFKTVLTSILKQKPDELIVIANGPYPTELMKLCQELEEKCRTDGHPTKMLTLYTPTPGKRNAIQLGLQHTDPESDICVLVDSDTIWTQNTLPELIKPFLQDQQIGGVTTRQKILNPTRSLVTMVASILEEIRAEGTMKAMSVTKKVGCLPGRTIAFRTFIMRRVIQEFMTEVFMGIHNEVSDDRSLTNLTLKLGYRTVLQDSSVVYTDAPVKWNAFIKQQMRWASGSQYNNLKMTPWMCRHAPLMAFIYWSDMLMPILLVSVYLNMTVCYVLKRLGLPVGSIEYTGSIWMILVFVFLGCMLGFGVRHIRVFLKLPWYYILMIPLLVMVLSFLMAYIRIFGLMRCADGTAWGTRVLSAEAPRQKSFRRKAMPAFAFILLCSCAIGGFRLLDYAPRLFRPVTVFDDTGKNVGIYQTEPADIELMREKPDILGWFEAWGTSPAKEKAQICIREHMTPLINWSPYDYTLTDIGNGKHDELIRNYLTEINQTYGDSTVLIRLAHEMENYDTGNWYPWQYKGGEKDYIHMWRHVVAIGREVAPHVRWIWSPNRMTPQSIRWYPGDEYVDYISITLNHKANRVPSYPIFEDYFRQEGVEKHFNRINKKIILSEVGYANQDETRRGEYLQSIFDWVEQDDRICGVVFFNHNKMEESQYRFSDSRYLMDIWYNGLQHMHQYSKNSAVTALQEAKKGE